MVVVLDVEVVDSVTVSSADRHAPEDCPEYALSQHLRSVSYISRNCGTGNVVMQRPSA
jgi:hypothetical protein